MSNVIQRAFLREVKRRTKLADSAIERAKAVKGTSLYAKEANLASAELDVVEMLLKKADRIKANGEKLCTT